MIKLMKYEIRKQLISKILLLGLLIFVEIVLLFGILIRHEDMMRVAHAVFNVISLFGMLYLIIEPAMVLYSDLGKKQGYLLFMTPNSTAKIIGSKLLIGVIQIIIIFSFMIGLIMINDICLSGYFNKDIDSLSNTFNAFGDVGFSMSEFAVTLQTISLMSFDFITLAFLAICISYSYVSMGKVNSFISVLLFFLIFIIEALAFGILFVMPFNGSGNTMTSFIVVTHLMFVLPAIINYLGIVRLIERRISL